MSTWLLTILICCGGIALVTAVALLRRGNIARGKSRAAAAAAVDDIRRSRDKADLELHCPVCREAAEPVAETDDRYRCTVCGHQFVAELHGWTTK